MEKVKHEKMNDMNVNMARFELPALPFSVADVSGWMSPETVDIHFNKHHLGYIQALNKQLMSSGYQNSTLEEIVKNSSGKIFNSAAQAWNHTFFWNSISSKESCEEESGLGQFPVFGAEFFNSFGTMEEFKKNFLSEASQHFGSGWIWLISDPSDGKLKVICTHDADNPLRKGLRPLLVCDLWEHAYYIDYRNNRKAFVEGFCEHINWRFAARNFQLRSAEFRPPAARPDKGNLYSKDH